jgi:hypothetical protein
MSGKEIPCRYNTEDDQDVLLDDSNDYPFQWLIYLEYYLENMTAGHYHGSYSGTLDVLFIATLSLLCVPCCCIL